jgi:hypothetical protein
MKIGAYNIRAFVATVPEMPDRTAFIMQHFKEVGIQAEEFHCLNAELAGVSTKHCYELDNPGSGWRIGEKPTALWLSFWAMWSAMSFMPDSHFLTMEWDAQFKSNWKELTEQALNDVPSDFDLLLLGSCCCNGAWKQRVKGNVWEVKYPACGHATIVAKKALPVMLRTQRKIYAPLDISLMLHTMPLLKVYCVIPRLAEQWNTVIPP